MYVMTMKISELISQLQTVYTFIHMPIYSYIDLLNYMLLQLLHTHTYIHLFFIFFLHYYYHTGNCTT